TAPGTARRAVGSAYNRALPPREWPEGCWSCRGGSFPSRGQLAGAAAQAYPAPMDPLVSTEWLAQHWGEPDLVVLDASWHMPTSGRSGRDEYRVAHIPGARFLDIDELSDRQNPAPHMLPRGEEFGAAMEQLGVGR